jgi:hypothetical protein
MHAHREQAGAQQHRAVRALRLTDAAAALEAEAATWQLLWHLHGARGAAFPGGTGGGDGAVAAGEATVAQRIAAMLAQDEGLNRRAPLACFIPTRFPSASSCWTTR